MKRLIASVAGVCLSLAAGCGPSVPYGTVKISGKVTYDDGSPIPGHRIVLRFVPQVQAINAKEFPRPGTTDVKPDGSFDSVTTWKYADGVIPGPQKIIVQSLDDKQKPTGAVDPVYGTSNTPLTVDIPKAGVYELKVAKPTAGKR